MVHCSAGEAGPERLFVCEAKAANSLSTHQQSIQACHVLVMKNKSILLSKPDDSVQRISKPPLASAFYCFSLLCFALLPSPALSYLFFDQIIHPIFNLAPALSPELSSRQKAEPDA
jgi:hypothetical protein